jgi:hypothetical protein
MKIILLLTLLLLSLSVRAADVLVIRDAVVPEKPPSVTVMGGFMSIENPTDKEIRIVNISSSQFDHVEMHQTLIKDNLARMIKQDALIVPANGKLELKRGSHHLMLFNPKIKFKSGDAVELVLTLHNGTSQKIVAKVMPATLDDDHSHHH